MNVKGWNQSAQTHTHTHRYIHTFKRRACIYLLRRAHRNARGVGIWRLGRRLEILHEHIMRETRACQHVAVIGWCFVPVHRCTALGGGASHYASLLGLTVGHDVVVSEVPRGSRRNWSQHHPMMTFPSRWWWWWWPFAGRGLLAGREAREFAGAVRDVGALAVGR